MLIHALLLISLVLPSHPGPVHRLTHGILVVHFYGKDTSSKICAISFDPLAMLPLKFVSPNPIMSLSSLNRISMAHFLKQSFAKLAQKKQTIVKCSNSIIEIHPCIVLGRIVSDQSGNIPPSAAFEGANPYVDGMKK